MTDPHDQGRSGIAELRVVWLLLMLVGVEILVTYTRTPVTELYHVRHGGISAGLSRTLAFVGFPTGLIALAIVAIVIDRVPRRAALLGVAGGAALAAAVAWPGALDEAGLDTPVTKTLAAIGVATTAFLSLSATRAAGRGSLGPRQPYDLARAAVAATFVVGALPWLAADLGLALDRLPLLGWLFQTDTLARQPGVPGLHPAVHDGHHHGMDGVLLVLAALILSRSLADVRHHRLRVALAAYLSFLLVYGAANAVQDFWLEQVVKRGWSARTLPMMLVPSSTRAWIAIPLLTLVLLGTVGRRQLRCRPVTALPEGQR